MDRTPPHNTEAEESLIGSMLLSADARGVGLEACTSEDFYTPELARIFEAIASLYERGQAIDSVTIVALDSRIQGHRLIELQSNTPSTANAPHYAKIVEEQSLLRRLQVAAAEIEIDALSEPKDVQATLDLAESRVFDVAQRKAPETVESVSDLLGPTMAHIEELGEHKGVVHGMATGYADLDCILAGLQPSSLTIVGARPAMGKTSLGLGMAMHVGWTRPALIFSLEMSRSELMQRILASEARVDAQRIRNGTLGERDWQKLSEAHSRLTACSVFIDDNPRLTVMDIRARARRLKKAKGDLGVVVVDYLQLMTGGKKAESRQIEVSEISRGLKILARELETPVVALSQLSRGLEQRSDKRPMLSDLRESGSLEQDSDVVLFVYRDEYYNPGQGNEAEAEIIVAKHRNGPTGHAKLVFLSAYARFDNFASTL